MPGSLSRTIDNSLRKSCGLYFPPISLLPKIIKELFIHISKFWESYMRLSSNKGYIQGEDLRLIDKHDIPDRLEQFDTWMCSAGKHPR
jgi:hypothetical protein